MRGRGVQVWLVEWIDSMSQGGWSRADRMTHEPGRIASVGAIAHEDAATITIAGHWDHQDPPNFTGAITIPRCAVIRKRRLALLERP